LNLGWGTADERPRVEENHRRLCEAAGLDLAMLRTVHQVHGDEVVEAAPAPVDADGVVTSREGEAVGVKTADCVPILIVDPVGRRVAAVHSGWRGTDREIAARAVEALAKRGADPQRLLAAIGPAIQVCCYEVSKELGERFRAKFGPDVAVEEDGHIHLDLPRAARRSLLRAGLREDNVDVLLECTSCRQDRYFSHRRDRGITGRHLNFAICRF
jgi:YfiH family protein